MSKKSGFSLIELLVVIAIIAIMAAILFPIFSNAKERGRISKCMFNLKNLTTAFRLYADDNDGKLPSAFYAWQSPDWCGVEQGYSNNVYPQRGSIWKYTTKNKEIYVCPTDKSIAPKTFQNASRKYPISYSMNWMLGATNKPENTCYGRDRVSIDSVSRPSKILLLIHEGRENIDDGCFYWFKGDNTIGNKPSKIHFDGTMVSYLDGHARWLSFNALIKDRDDEIWDPLKTR